MSLPLWRKRVSCCETLCTKRARYLAKRSGDQTLGAGHVESSLELDRMQGAQAVVQSPGLVRIEVMQKIRGPFKDGTDPTHGL